MATDKDRPPAPTWEELHLRTLFSSALANWQYFDEHLEDGPLKDYIKHRVEAHVKKLKESESENA